MTSIIPDHNPTALPRQRLAAVALARLLIMPLPEVASWRIGGICDLPKVSSLSGHLPHTRLDVQRTRLHQWAAVLDNAAWSIDPWAGDNPGGELRVRGSFMDCQVEVWIGLTAEQVALGVSVLAELDEQPAGGAR